MTNRNSAPSVPQAPRVPWPHRHPRLFAACITTSILMVSACIAVGIEVKVRMPLAVPVGSITAAVYAMYLYRTAARAYDQLVAARRPVRAPVTWALNGYDDDLIGRDERDAVLGLLADRYSTEHLDEDEYGHRHTMVLKARYRRDLRPAVTGLTW